MENYAFQNPHKSSFLNTDLPVDSIETEEGAGLLFLGPLTLSLIFNTVIGAAPNLFHGEWLY